MRTSLFRRAARRALALPVVVLSLLAVPAVAGATAPHPVVDPLTHELKDSVTGSQLQLRGVNWTGTEYMCFDPTTDDVFDRPGNQTNIDRMKAWKINVVRLPLNEHCWTGTNGWPATATPLTPAQYKSQITAFVNLLVRNDIAVVLSMHFYAPGRILAEDQYFMADMDHAPEFWTDVANTFKTNPAVVFDLVNEPQMLTADTEDDAWDCWKNGEAACSGYNRNHPEFSGYDARTQPNYGRLGFAGIDDLISAVRTTGATNPVIADGLRFGNDLTGFLAHMPTDPAGQLIAGFHNYGDFIPGCVGLTCYPTEVAPVNAQVPVVAGEFGTLDCSTGYAEDFMTWADAQAHKVSYIAWAWTTGGCDEPALIRNDAGAPTVNGREICTHFRAVVGASACPRSSAPPA
jgi:hypothetical protein